MKKIINILKSNGFTQMDTGMYANDKGVLFILTKSDISIINGHGDWLEEFRNIEYDPITCYLIVGYLYSKGWLKDGYKLPKKYQIY